MTRWMRNAFAVFLVHALVLAVPAHAQRQLQPVELYQDTWSAQDMLGVQVLDVNGDPIGTVRDLILDADGWIERAVIGVSGVLGIGERYLGVPWNEIGLAPDLAFVQVPVREDTLPEFSLFRGVEDDVVLRQGSWRVRQLIGEFASLEDVPRYGIVDDVIFDAQGRARGVIVDRAAGRWGQAGWYGYPYAGYHPGGLGWPVPGRSEDMERIPVFSYAELGRQSRYASEQSERAQQQVMAAQRMGERVLAEQTPVLDPEGLYESGWSGEQMIGTEARDVHGEPIGAVRDIVLDADGLVQRVVIGVSGLLGIGERYIAVPWNELAIGYGMAYVRTAVREETLPEFSLFRGIEDDVALPAGRWRLNELLGEFAALKDVPRYGIVNDVIFDEGGQAQAVIVARGAGWWGGPDWYAFPFVGFDRAASAYALPYHSEDIGALQRFDYVRFNELQHVTSAVMPRERAPRR